MTGQFTRRDFLKLTGLLSLSLSAPEFLYQPAVSTPNSNGQNVLIVVFDAMSAYQTSLYGYERKTVPNLSRLAEKATVYHEHYAGGHFTTPGTASLLTGTLPWTHRAFIHDDTVAKEFVNKNIFQAFEGYHRMTYSHNPLANTLLRQFLSHIEDYTPQERLFLNYDDILQKIFRNDADITNLTWTRAVKQTSENPVYSMFFSRLYKMLKRDRSDAYKSDFPRGLPFIYNDLYYILEHGIDWLQDLMLSAPKPFLGYFHFLPPHYPYKTRREFFDAFEGDGYTPVAKPSNVFGRIEQSRLDKFRRWYDEFLLYVDAEFARLYNFMAQKGLLENTWLVFTSDHGEMFERGIVGHLSPNLYQTVVRIPLLIFEPGQNVRKDVFERTSAIDVLPTMMHVTGQESPPWVEGKVLPPYSSSTSTNRDIFVIQGKGTEKGERIQKGSAMLVRDNYKLIHIFGYAEDYDGGDIIELYDIEADPGELTNLYPARKTLAEDLLKELHLNIDAADRKNVKNP